MLTNDDLDTIYARAHDAADWYFTDDVIALVGELRAERTRVHQLEWDKSLVESELAGVSENLAAERTRTETLRDALEAVLISSEKEGGAGYAMNASLRQADLALRALGLPPADQPRDRCECGHIRAKHIYHEGACRPGFVCPAGCKRFVRAALAASVEETP